MDTVLTTARDRCAATSSVTDAISLWTPDATSTIVENPWRDVRAPTTGATESIGSYSAGCLRGAQALEKSSQGFEVMRLSRRRFFGHPRLLNFLRNLAASVQSAGLGKLLIGDLGQPRGGPTLSGHASHQIGLDVDVWLRLAPAGQVPSDSERERWSSPQMVIPDFEGVSKAWDPRVVELLRLAAQDDAVERIFINPVIKKAVCDKHGGAAWLQKIRPWWFHDDHFHARLRCQSGDPRCSPQEPTPAGDGCGAELAGWFTPERKAEARRMREAAGKPRELPKLPEDCAKVLKES